MGKKAHPRNYPLFRKCRNKAIRGLNNIYVLNELSCKAILSARKQLRSDKSSELDFDVPSIKGVFVTTVREKTKVIQLLGNAVDEDLPKQFLISSVAIAENYMSEVLRLVLRAFPEKLKSQGKKVDLDLVLDSADIEGLVSTIIEHQIHSVFFAAPEKYFKYIETILSIKIAEPSKEQYVEVKATRDLLVHNEGIINETYVRKAGRLARGKVGDTIPVDEMYFDPAIRTMKKLVNNICNRSIKKFGESKEFSRWEEAL